MSEPFSELGDAIDDQRYVDVDLALRRGAHVDREDADWYAYLLDAQAVLEPFYRRYGCELVHRSDGYFFLLPTGDKVGKRLLGLPEMIVGQGAALLYLDPRAIESGGVTTKDDLLSHLAAVMGTDTLVGVFNPKRKRMDERVAQETVRQRIAEGLRKLAQLGFITLAEDGRILLRSALMRFADPVRGAGSPRDALEKLIARGEVSVPGHTSDDIADDDAASDDAADETGRDDTTESHEEMPLGVERPSESYDDASDFDSEDDEDATSDDEDTPFDEDPIDVAPGFDHVAPSHESARPRRAHSSDEGDVDLGRDSFATDFEEPTPPSSSVRPGSIIEPAPAEGKPARKKRKRESIHPETLPEPTSRRSRVKPSADSSSESSDDVTFDVDDFAPELGSIPTSALDPSFDEFD